MNPFKLLVPLFIAYNLHAADPKDVDKVVDILKTKGFRTEVKDGFRYEKTFPMSDDNKRVSMMYQEIKGGVSALSFNLVEVKGETIKTTALIDFLGGKPDGTPDKYVIVEIDSRTAMDMYHNGDTNFDSFETERGKPKASHKRLYDGAIEVILKESKSFNPDDYHKKGEK